MNDSRDQFVVNMKPVSPVFHTEETVSIGLKKGTQSGNIHSTILDVYVGRQTQNFPFIFLQFKLDNNFALLLKKSKNNKNWKKSI